MGWVMQKTLFTFLICRRTPVRFGFCVEMRFPFFGMGLLARQILQGRWRALQNLRGFLPAFEIKKGTYHLSLWAGGQLNYLMRLVSAKVRLRELLHEARGYNLARLKQR